MSVIFSLNLHREPLKTSLTVNFLRLCTSSALAKLEIHQVFTAFRCLEAAQSPNENLLVFRFLENPHSYFVNGLLFCTIHNNCMFSGYIEIVMIRIKLNKVTHYCTVSSLPSRSRIPLADKNNLQLFRLPQESNLHVHRSQMLHCNHFCLFSLHFWHHKLYAINKKIILSRT